MKNSQKFHDAKLAQKMPYVSPPRASIEVLDASSWYASLDAIRDGIVITDHLHPDEPIVFANKAFLILTGYCAEEVIGRNCSFLQGKDRSQPELLLVREALEVGTDADVVVRNYRKDGSMFVNRLTVAPLKRADGVISHFIGVQHDMTKEVELVKVANRGRVELARFFEESRDLLITLNRHKIVKRINPVAVELLGEGAGVGLHAIDLLPKAVNELLGATRSATRSWVAKRISSLRVPYGPTRDRVIQWSVYPLPAGETLVIGIDITEHDVKRQAELVAREERGVLDSATDGFVNLDRAWRVVYLNSKAEELLGKPRKELLGHTITELYPESFGSRFHQEYDAAVATNEPRSFTEFHTSLNRWLNVHCFPRDDGLALLIRDLTEQAELHARLSYLARFDSVTGLPNRHACLTHLEQLVADRSASVENSENSRHYLSVLYLDLDGFKDMNDIAGHAACDAFLSEVGARIALEVQERGFIGRISGDEFMVAVEGLDEIEVKHLAERLIERIAQPFVYDSHSLSVGASIGIATYPGAGQLAGQLLQNADTAMYFAKRAGRLSVRAYTLEMARSEADQLRILQDLKNAIPLNQLELFYQPKFDLSTGMLVGGEALLRWNHPTRGLLGPTAFIGVAEESALIVEIGAWVLRQACWQAAEWRKAGSGGAFRIDVNLSARQLVDPRFPEFVATTLARYGVNAGAIGLEITESMLTVDMDQAAHVLESFRAMGLSVALDDFGTGYSNLAYIQHFPITTLKIDKSFVQRIEMSGSSRALVNGIISMARALELQVVAEGVETRAQLEFLVRQKCDAMQGYLMSPPVPADVFEGKFLIAEPSPNALVMLRGIGG